MRARRTVIGVVGDVRGAAGQGPRGGGLDLDPGSAAYFAVTQQPLSGMTLVVRTSDDSTATASLLRQAAQAIDPAQPVTQVRRLRDWLDETAAEPRFTSFLSGAFAGVALILAAVGMYGVLAGAVAQRTKEIGVRMAVGAARGQIVRMVLRWGFTVAASGIAIGLARRGGAQPGTRNAAVRRHSRDPSPTRRRRDARDGGSPRVLRAGRPRDEDRSPHRVTLRLNHHDLICEPPRGASVGLDGPGSAPLLGRPRDTCFRLRMFSALRSH